MLLYFLRVMDLCCDWLKLSEIVYGQSDCGNIIIKVSQLHVTYTWPSWQPWGSMRDHSWVCLCPLFQAFWLSRFFSYCVDTQVCDWERNTVSLSKYSRKTGSYKGWIHFIRSSERQSWLWIIILTYYGGIPNYRRLMWHVGNQARKQLATHHSLFTIHHWCSTSDKTLLNSLFSLGQKICKTSLWSDSGTVLSAFYRVFK